MKIPRPMRGTIAPVFSFGILWIDISFFTYAEGEMARMK